MEPTVVAVIIAACIALILQFLNHRQNLLEARRTSCAEALTDVQHWIELPFRIQRRTDSDPETIGRLRTECHELQNRLDYHDNWLRFHAREAQRAYHRLLEAVRRETEEAIRSAWESDPIDKPGDVKQGDAPATDAGHLMEEFCDRVREDLALIPSIDSLFRSLRGNHRRRA